MKRRAQNALGCLAVLGAFVVLYGIVGPTTDGAAFAEVIVDELVLRKTSDTYSTLTTLYAEHEARRGIALSVLGLFIAVPAVFGLWALHHDRP
jgi:hypothetical protein